jgi:hypothetical protein
MQGLGSWTALRRDTHLAKRIHKWIHFSLDFMKFAASEPSGKIEVAGSDARFHWAGETSGLIAAAMSCAASDQVIVFLALGDQNLRSEHQSDDGRGVLKS